jgi:RecA-family ATPase
MSNNPPADESFLEIRTDEEQAIADYEYERWQEDPTSWEPLVTLEQLKARPNLEIQWYAPHFIPVGAKTILSAEPKTGKTILLFHILKAVINGEKLFGRQCAPQKVIYLTEQTEHEFRMQAEEVPGLMGNPNFYVLLPEAAPTACITWQGTLKWAEQMLNLTKAKILVMDTFGSIAKLPPMGENDSSTIQNYINEMNFLFQNRYLSVVLTHHNRKTSYEGGKNQNQTISAIRGSSAFAGGAGHVITMGKIDVDPNARNINIDGRYMKCDKVMALDEQTHVYKELKSSKE